MSDHRKPGKEPRRALISDTDLDENQTIWDKPLIIPKELVPEEDRKSKLVCYDNVAVFKLPPKGQHFRKTPPCKGRRPPAKRIFYGCGPLGPTGSKMTFKEKLKAMYVTKEMVEKCEDTALRTRITMAELALFLIYIAILAIVIFRDHEYSSFDLYNSMTRAYIFSRTTGPANIRFNFLEIKQVADVYQYLRKPFLEATYSEYYYDYDHAITEVLQLDKNVLYENALLGRVKLRQIRVQRDSCEVMHYFRRQFTSCYGWYSHGIEDGEPWAFNGQDEPIWEHVDPKGEPLQYYVGTFGFYGPKGFHQYLEQTYSENLNLIQKFKNYKWFDRATRVMFVDLTVYNTQINTFCTVKLVFEFPPSGGVFTQFDILPTKLFPYLLKIEYFFAAFEILFVLMVFFHTFEEAREMFYFRGEYWLRFWNWVDLLQVVQAFYSCIFLFIRATMYEPNITALARKHRNSYVNIDTYVFWQWLYIKCNVTLFFQAFIKLFKYAQLTAYMGELVITIQYSVKDQGGFIIMFMIIFLAFAELGYLLFGARVAAFKSYSESWVTLLKLIFGDFNYLELEDAERTIGPLYFLSFVFFLFFSLLNVFLGIVNYAYTKVRRGRMIGELPRVHMEKYLQSGFYNVCVCCPKPNQGALARYRYREPFNTMERALKKQNFTPTEIEMLFAKYGVNAERDVEEQNVHDLLKDLESKNHKPTEPPRMDEIKLSRAERELIKELLATRTDFKAKRGLTIANYQDFIERLLYIEETTDEMIERLTIVLERMAKAEKFYWTNVNRRKYELFVETAEATEEGEFTKTWKDKAKEKEVIEREEWEATIQERMTDRRARLEARRSNISNRSKSQTKIIY